VPLAGDFEGKSDGWDKTEKMDYEDGLKTNENDIGNASRQKH